MTTALATTNGTAPARPAAMPEVMERVIAMGDLSRLSPEDRIAYYAARCEAAGLDPRTQPFQYLSLQGKLTLYATKGATDQLIAARKLTVEIVDRRHDRDLGIFEVHCRVRFPDGHHVEDFAALNVKGLQGEGLCNALMKAVTKAKRRTVLSACGLGMLDETEVETIPGAATIAAAPTGQIEPPKNDSGHGRGQYASPDQVKAYLDHIGPYLEKRDGAWLDRFTDKQGEILDGVKSLGTLWEVENQLVRWAIDTGRLDRACMPDERGIKNRQIGMYTAIVYHRSKADKSALLKEIVRYLDQCEARQMDALRKKYPGRFEDDAIEAEVIAATPDEASGMADED